jgi:chromosome segregation protein
VRLTKLKLAGFKSFVDPTTVLFPGNLGGIVGPNGCGKSNIIDAARWVLGESKASELRGESIQDVIFKGSGTRKEVSRCSVELFFDNSDGKASGQWSQYAEITVRRVLDRDGNSNYYINNLNVRRRDIIDLFLGTGLGPRSYAIIGQGMISRIIESKPDELRGFLEEAAGVTKYKERRRETENRLEDARENLARVDDIRGELDNQIVRLEGQAEVARQYRDLQAQMTGRQNLLWYKKRMDARRDSEKLHLEVEQAITRVEGETAQLREVEARVEHAREAHFSASDALHAAQAEMYSAKSEVERLESEIGHMRDNRQRLETRIAQLTTEDGHWRGQQAELSREAERWSSLKENAGARAEAAKMRHEEASERMPQLEELVESSGAQLTDARRILSEAEHALKLADAEKSHAGRTLDTLTQRRERLEQEKSALPQPDPMQLEIAQQRTAESEELLETEQARMSELQERLPELEGQVRQARERMQAAHRQLTEARARCSALEQLQARVQQSGEMGPWLEERGLKDVPLLWQSIQVETGWETAVEAVLRERLSARYAHVSQIAAALETPPPATLALAYAGSGHAAATGSLRAKVKCTDAKWDTVLDEWLGGINAADELQAGMAGVSVNRAGHIASPHGLVLYVPDAKTHGVIERQREIEELNAQMGALSEAEELARESQHEAEQAVNDTQTALTNGRRTVQEAQQRLHAAQVESLKLNQLQARYDERVGQIDHDLAEILRAEENERASQMRSDEQLGLYREQLDALRERGNEAAEALRRAETQLREARSLEQQLAREAQEAHFSERECANKLEDNARATDTAVRQIERIVTDLEQARTDLATISEGLLGEALQTALQKRTDYENALADKRNTLESAAGELRGLDELRLKLEQSVQPLRERINELRMKEQAAQLNEEQFSQRLLEANVTAEDEQVLSALLTPNLRDSQLQGDITRLGNEIEALGSVNMAALEELASARERKNYLDEQSTDLADAINTLEDAIRRIDHETREQLQETYNTVNRQFGELFPSLFGGGEAKLILTGDEILDAGIQIMAQPPGKKNSTIHLLSGGEKALTAIALVFAMFQLNPAPFCMLDEVDAPLDDSNTERFANLVKKMSSQTQFIFISHNKIAMEMATQLIGVTMQEKGVSRVVEVDMEEALRLADDQVAA